MADDMVGVVPSEHRGQAHHHRFRDDQPVRDVQVAAHPVGIHRQALRDRACV
jgi:hypothetical protein